jgi:hypothetical protein
VTDINYGVAPDWGLMRQQASTAWQQAQAQLNERRRQALDSTGYSYSVDGNGNLQLGALDPSKQYGSMQLMMQQQGQDVQQNHLQQLNRGVGQYGMGNQQERLIRFQHAAQQMQQAQGLQNQLSDFDLAQQQGTQGYNDQLAQIASQQGQYQAGQQQYAAAQNQSAANQQNIMASLMAMLQGGGM